MNTFYPPHSTLTAGSKVVAYLRDSGGTNQEESIDRQEGEVRRWCAEYGLILTGIYTDEAKSGRNELHKRKDLHSMMAHLRNGADEGAVVIWNYERFARNIKHGRHFIAEIESLDKVVCSLTDNIPEGPERYFIQDLKLWGAEQTSVKISIDVTSGLRKMVETYGGMPGTPPRGFMRSEPIVIGKHRNGEPRIVRKWIPDPDLTPTVLLAFQMRARGASLKQIMATTGIHKTKNSYTTFFNNRLYMGILEFGDLVIENYCEPIIPPALWDKVQQVNQQRKRISPNHNPRRYASTFILSGLVHCQHCGSPLNAHIIEKKGKRLREYYTCMRRYRRHDCPGRGVPRLALEAEVLRLLEDRALDLETMLRFRDRVMDHYKRMNSQLEGERLRLTRSLREQSKRINHLVDAIAERGHSHSLLTALHQAEIQEAAYRAELENLEKNIQPPEEHTPEKLTALAEQIKRALHGDDGPDMQKNAIHMLTSRIIVSREDDHINGVLYYIPNVCVGSSAPAEIQTEDIQFLITIPKYTKARS